MDTAINYRKVAQYLERKDMGFCFVNGQVIDIDTAKERAIMQEIENNEE